MSKKLLVDRVRRITGDNLPVFETLTSQAGAITPIFTEGGLINRTTGLKVPGIFIGRCGLDGFGANFEYDEYQLYAAKVIQNLNVIVLGEINQRKSGLVKAYIDQGWKIGYNNFVIDPKDEYNDIAGSIPGAKIVRFNKGSEHFVNVLDPLIPPALQVELIASMAAIAMSDRDYLTTKERHLITKAVKEVKTGAESEGRVPLLPDLVKLLFNPTRELVEAVRMEPDLNNEPAKSDPDSAWANSVSRVKDLADDVAKALERLTDEDGDLFGPFHKETSEGMFEPSPLLVFNCNNIPDEAKVILITLFNFFVEGLWEKDKKSRFHRIFLDESWELAQYPIYVLSVRRLFKLGRSMGVAIWIVLHHLSNLERSGNHKAVLDLINDADTIVNFKQKINEIRSSAEMLEINPRAGDQIAKLEAGQAVWKVGRGNLIPVTHIVSDRVKKLSETSHLLQGHDISSSSATRAT